MASDAISQRYRRMARNNRWSNFRLLGACARAGDPALAAPGVSFFPSMLATLNHILIVDRYYVDALSGGSLGVKAFATEMPCLTIAELGAAQLAIDLQCIAFCDGLDDAELANPVSLQRTQSTQTECIEDVINHLFTHQIHHRGQVHAMLSGTAVKPPQLDEFYCDMDRPLRETDLARMFTEAY